MEKLVSNWCNNVRDVPEDYIFPPETRPGNVHVPMGESIPVIDLSLTEKCDRALTIQKIIKASQEFGFFQVINHGIPEKLMKEAMSVWKEFFQLPAEANQDLFTEGFTTKDCWLTTSSLNYATEKVHMWRDALRHPCHPLETWQHMWPQTPTRYQECVGACSVEVKKLGSRILRLISEGLGLHGEYLDDYSQTMILSANHYPTCPEPNLTLGVSKHADPFTITLLLQDDVYGLQVLKDDGTWIGVDPNPHAIVVNIASQLQVISNNKLKSAEHRAVTNSSKARISAAFFIGAWEETFIEPAKTLIDELHPPIYKPFKSKEFLSRLYATYGDSQATLEFFKA